MRLVLPTSASTLSSSISLVASAATCWGLVCSDSTMYLIGRPLMPPLSLTQEKYACAMPVMPVKSVPGCLVTIAPSVSGVPVAFWPLPMPHLAAVAPFELGVFVAVPPPPPQAAASSDKPPSSAASTAGVRGLTRLMCVLNLVLLLGGAQRCTASVSLTERTRAPQGSRSR